MSLRRPGGQDWQDAMRRGISPIEIEIAAEMASALGRAGDKVERTLAALKAHAGGQPERPVLVKEAAEAVYAYFIQREICGMRRHQDVIREYAIPNEVLVRLGAK